jgi:hypothetical protein
VLKTRSPSTSLQRRCLGWYRLPVVLRGAKTVSCSLAFSSMVVQCSMGECSALHCLRRYDCSTRNHHTGQRTSTPPKRFSLLPYPPYAKSTLFPALSASPRRINPVPLANMPHPSPLCRNTRLTNRQQLLYKIDTAKLGAREAPRGEGQSTEQGTALPS